MAACNPVRHFFQSRLKRIRRAVSEFDPVRGSHGDRDVTLPMIDPSNSYTVSLTDDEYKLVFSRLGDRLRIAGTAELNGYDTSLNLVRCKVIVRRVRELFPQIINGRDARYWTGLQPATPSNVPYIGLSRINNLFLNTGHGTLGWTHAAGSGQAIPDIVSGRRPAFDFAFTSDIGGRVNRVPPRTAVADGIGEERAWQSGPLTS